jgi:AraC family transcriptional regulator, L-rhamnose operon regulatory protein RhaS
MRRYVQHEPFNIYCFEAERWEHPVHKHTYFEIIFILKGKGTHTINDNSFQYAKGDVFLLGPEDYHEFSIRTVTEFCYIRFMESFFNSASSDKQWKQTVELLLHSSFQSKGSLVQDKSEKSKLHALLGILRSEYDQRRNTGFEFMRDHLMKSMMMILARNIVNQALPNRKSLSNHALEEILLYIRQHIYEPELLRMDRLSRQFNYAPSYLSIFFKKHTGESLKQYIVQYKTKLIETRLLYSQATLGEIAAEFGFTDESHLSKQFRKYSGLTPGDFRKAKR